MRRIRLNTVLAVVWLLTGFALAACSTAGEYRKPDIAFPEQYRGAPQSSSERGKDGKAFAEMPYSTFFSDTELRGLIDSAVSNNIDLQIALKNIDIARETLGAARLGILPAMNIGAAASLSHPSDNGPNAIESGNRNVRNFTASASVSWEADIWGKIQSRKKSALASYLKTEEAAKAVRTRLVADVAQGWYNLLMLDTQLQVSKKNLALADTTLQMIRLQHTAGLVTSLAVQQQEAARGAVALSLPVIESQIAAQEHALSILCGRMPAPVQRKSDLFSIAVTDNLPAGLPAELLENRPDVRAAEMAVRAAHADMGEAKAGLYPTLTITAEGGVNALRSSEWFSFPGSLFSFVQGAVLQPLFQHGELKAKYEQSRIRRDQSDLAFRQAVLNAVGEVSDVLVQLEKIKTQELIAADRAATLRKAVSNSGMLFRSGMATYLEVIVAQTNALQAELALADIRRQHLAAMAELYRALGGGWK